MQQGLNLEMYEASLTALRFSLIAKLEAAKGYVLNTDLQIDCQIMRKQISAIENEISRLNLK